MNARRSTSVWLAGVGLCAVVAVGCDDTQGDVSDSAAFETANDEGGASDASASPDRMTARELYGDPEPGADPYEAADFAAISGGEINISTFTYRDSGQTGDYRIGDAPFGGVAVAMTTPDGAGLVRRSNIRGFSNFEMSRFDRELPVSEPGTYHFEVIAPPGWEISSGNERQSVDIEPRRGSIGGLIADPVPEPVGLNPVIEVRGRVVYETGRGAFAPAREASIAVVDPLGEPLDVELDDHAEFRFPAGDGDWTITAESAHGDGTTERTVTVGDTPVVMSDLVVDRSDPPDVKPESVTVDFDQLDAPSLEKIPSGFAGVHWEGVNALKKTYYRRGVGYLNTAMEGNYVAYNTSGHPVAIELEDGFDFSGAYFGVGWPWAEGEELILKAWRDDEQVARDVIELSSYGPVWFDADYRAITRLELSTRNYWQFVMDAPVIRRHR